MGVIYTVVPNRNRIIPTATNQESTVFVQLSVLHYMATNYMIRETTIICRSL